ncbi:DUF1707 domain-containing protein [Actinosynnema sp. NPDC020468]|uniref:DUF1707 SHOCT-like domain-containing protein n=1 Tax=Actinosynnema sp. NPDC020468 TaxID=3154488 RepID=UPI0033F0524D
MTDSSFLRAADGDRAAVAAVLGRAHAEGRITLAEFDERTAAVWAARTYGELTALTADLPNPVAPAPRSAVAARRPDVATRVVTGAWMAAGAINLLIWGVLSLSLGKALYPWWIWVVGPWGIVLLAARFGRSR